MAEPCSNPDLPEEMQVRSIAVEILPIFGEKKLGWPYSMAEQLKFSTKERAVRQHLLFKEGDYVSQFVIDESARILRSQKYLRGARIETVRDGHCVDVKVTVQDTWSMIPQITYSFGGGHEHKALGIEESNLLGLGKRVELLYDDNIGRKSVEAVWHDPHVWNSDLQLIAGFFDRNDGEIFISDFGKPFRSLVDEYAWGYSGYQGRTVGRLFRDGTENYIFRRSDSTYSLNYAIAAGPAQSARRRYSIGYRYNRNLFSKARPNDYEDLDLNPADMDRGPGLLPEDRKYSGPQVGYSSNHPRFVSMNYIDRFERVQDFNIGETFDFTTNLAPKFLNSYRDTLLFSVNKSVGWDFGSTAFLNAEAGAASRLDPDGFSNTLVRAEIKHYDVLGQQFWGDLSLGRHTLAFSYYIDYGDDLDRDRQFLVGGNNALRGYDVAAFSGDKRTALNIEDRVHLMDDVFKLFSLGGALFADVGGATNESLGKLFSDQLYANVGIGLRFAFPRVSGSRVLRIDCAFPLRTGPDGTEAGDLRVLFSGGQLFGSTLRSQLMGAENANVGVGFDR
ncbi:MAG: hypothetical protein GX589_01500 [Deltaproteobacteria bacterium]|nr:hypothetical protein [Deltaproteobacteria bacterium]